MKRRNRSNPLSLFAFQDIITGLCGIMVFLVLLQALDLAMVKISPTVDEDRIEEPIDDNREDLKREIALLESELSRTRQAALKAVQVPKDRVKQEDLDKVSKELSEREQIVAALVSQVHDLETQVELSRKTDAENREKVKEMERTRRLLEKKIASMDRGKGVTLIPERGEFKIPIFMVCSWKGVEIHRPFEKTRQVTAFPQKDVKDRLMHYFAEVDHTTHSVVLLVRPTGVKVMDEVVGALKDLNLSYGRDPLEEDVEIAFRKEVTE